MTMTTLTVPDELRQTQRSAGGGSGCSARASSMHLRREEFSLKSIIYFRSKTYASI